MPAMVAASLLVAIGAPGRAAACDDTVRVMEVLGVDEEGRFAIETRSSGGRAADRYEIAVHDRHGTIRARLIRCDGAECDNPSGTWTAEGPDMFLASLLIRRAGTLAPARVRPRVIERLALEQPRRSGLRASVRERQDGQVTFHVGRPGAELRVGEALFFHFGPARVTLTPRVLESERSSQLFFAYGTSSRGGGCSARYSEVRWFPRGRLTR